MGRSSDAATPARSVLRTVRADGTPIYRWDQRPGVPPVRVVPFDPDCDTEHLPPDNRHAHDFWVLAYVERGGGPVGLDGRQVTLRDGEVHAVAPGEVVAAESIAELTHARAWSVAFTPDAIPSLASISPLTWAHHPLLALFAADGRQALVPEAERPRWQSWLAELADELQHPDRLGAPEAITAILTNLLVASARLAPSAPIAPDPLVSRVFDEIERTYATKVTAGDLARSLGYTPGHLTTVLRQRTGRTLLDWLTERRLTEARRLLRETDLPLSVISTRTGLTDPGYLVRRFKARYGTTPDRWRREA
ncbi:AraC family transcriptional regulator [Nocardioides sp. KC13]|uniref:AraC family transcriptional regulator n=1 Tax=Nocardioides turkmenicus TaxID=2711220 RepID=A0A6M1R5H4_9ACTN|nr:AraC family transcriptional regulator [Nocardioides sp. KC13]NGN92919.1 AraC family transcriptional regulator [Nocardioides sp. KC13]